MAFKKNNMEKFKMTYEYNHQKHTAIVAKSTDGNKTDYVIQLDSDEIIQKFGKQITLFRENGSFAVNTAKDGDYIEFVNILTNALYQVENN